MDPLLEESNGSIAERLSSCWYKGLPLSRDSQGEITDRGRVKKKDRCGDSSYLQREKGRNYSRRRTRERNMMVRRGRERRGKEGRGWAKVRGRSQTLPDGVSPQSRPDEMSACFFYPANAG
jgi:hypothetical protein